MSKLLVMLVVACLVITLVLGQVGPCPNGGYCPTGDVCCGAGCMPGGDACCGGSYCPAGYGCCAAGCCPGKEGTKTGRIKHSPFKAIPVKKVTAQL